MRDERFLWPGGDAFNLIAWLNKMILMPMHPIGPSISIHPASLDKMRVIS
jgi:hypothetical protein